jgi:large subunit ribosomal protein L21
MQRKKKTRKKKGHRQETTRFMIDSISVNGTVLAARDLTQAVVETPQTAETASE